MLVAIIPARGGSKRIPRKNIRLFDGRPIISYAIECAQKSALFNRIIVSTDDEEIGAIARSLGAETPFVRPTGLANDYTGTSAVIAHALDWLIEQRSSVTAACCIYPTAPFISAQDVIAGYHALISGRWNYIFSATTYAFPVQRAFVREPSGSVRMLQPEHQETRSQDLPETLHDAGQFYWGRTEAWQNGEPLFGPKSSIICVPRWRVQDIDTNEDWTQAEIMSTVVRTRP